MRPDAIDRVAEALAQVQQYERQARDTYAHYRYLIENLTQEEYQAYRAREKA